MRIRFPDCAEAMGGTILIVDDDPLQRRLLEGLARRFGYRVIALDNGEGAVRLLSGPEGRDVDLLILDLVMPELDGFAVMERLRKAGVRLPIIVQTANGSVDAVTSAMRAGACDFMVKPVGPERFQISVRNALAAEALAVETRRLGRGHDSAPDFGAFAASGDAMRAAIELGRRAAASNIPVLIEGEPGTGKSLFARAIAGAGDGRPFVSLDCRTVRANLAGTVLSGRDPGVVTTLRKQPGKLAEAQGGTLFLDEVGRLPAEAQVELLRAIGEGEIAQPGRRTAKSDVRLIASTTQSLLDLVKQGRFREELYYRLAVFPIGLPPLRSRGGDIAALARSFLVRIAAEEGRPVRAIAPTALALLESHSWPGNVRELENAIFRAILLAEGDELTTADFPQFAPSAAMPAVVLRLSAAAPEPQTVPGLSFTGPQGHVRALETIERDAIEYALARYGGQMTEIARRLGIGRSTLYRKLKDYGLGDAVCGALDTRPPEAAA